MKGRGRRGTSNITKTKCVQSQAQSPSAAQRSTVQRRAAYLTTGSDPRRRGRAGQGQGRARADGFCAGQGA